MKKYSRFIHTPHRLITETIELKNPYFPKCSHFPKERNDGKNIYAAILLNVDTIVQVVVVTFTKGALFRSTRKSTFFTKKTIATFHPKNSTMNFVQSSYNEVQSLLIGSASGDVKTPTRSLLVPLMGLRDITKSPAVFQLQQ